MVFTKKQRAAVKAIVSCHETGKPVGNYSAFVVLPDDAGITYGCHQATHKSGSLHKIVQMYCNISNSDTSKGLESYVSGLKNPALRHKYAKDAKLKSLLKQAGNEPAMRFSQDRVFEVNYFEPALRAVEGSGWTQPLSLAVVYDSMIQGGWTTVRDRVKGDTEKDWIKSYVAARRRWLAGSRRPIVRGTVYRMKTFETLMANGNWELEVPITVHGAKITGEHLAVWMAAEAPTTSSISVGFVDTIAISEPSTGFFEGNTEGMADEPDELSAGGSWAEDEVEDINGGVSETEPPVDTIEEESSTPDNGKTGDPAKAGEPVPDAPAQQGEAIVGGRPQDPPIIIEKPTEETPSGWKTWPTTITATLGSLGLSAGGIFTSMSGVNLSPQLQMTIGWIIILGLVSAAGYGLFYLVTRMMAKNREAQRAHDIQMKELELRSMPDRYNVKIDRRDDVSNLTASGLPIPKNEERRTDV